MWWTAIYALLLWYGLQLEWFQRMCSGAYVDYLWNRLLIFVLVEIYVNVTTTWEKSMLRQFWNSENSEVGSWTAYYDVLCHEFCTQNFVTQVGYHIILLGSKNFVKVFIAYKSQRGFINTDMKTTMFSAINLAHRIQWHSVSWLDIQLGSQNFHHLKIWARIYKYRCENNNFLKSARIKQFCQSFHHL